MCGSGTPDRPTTTCLIFEHPFGAARAGRVFLLHPALPHSSVAPLSAARYRNCCGRNVLPRKTLWSPYGMRRCDGPPTTISAILACSVMNHPGSRPAAELRSDRKIQIHSHSQSFASMIGSQSGCGSTPAVGEATWTREGRDHVFNQLCQGY